MSTQKKFLFYKILIVAGLGIAELSLRIAGWGLNTGSILARGGETSQAVIVTLGESTTATHASPGADDWPTILQKDFEDRHLAYRIVNRGKSGTTSPALVGEFVEDYENAPVDLVIAMMGINDLPQFWRRDYFLVGHQGFWAELRLVKLLRLALSTLQPAAPSVGRARPHVYQSFLDFPDPDGLVERLRHDKPAPDLDEFVKNLSPTQAAQLYARIADSLRPPWGQDPASFERSYAFLRKSVAASFAVDYAPEIFILEAKMTRRPQDCSWIAELFLERNFAPNDVEMARLASCDLQSPQIQKIFARYGAAYAIHEGYELPTRANYRALHNFLRTRHVCLIVVQYPRLPVQLAKEFVGESDDIFFVDNSENFEDALRHHPYPELFTDNFARIFGHATQLGNTLIAQNVAAMVDHVMQQPQCRRR